MLLSCDFHGDALCVGEWKFLKFDGDAARAEIGEDALGDFFGKCFDEFAGTLRGESFDGIGYAGVVNGVGNFVGMRGGDAIGRQLDGGKEALGIFALAVWDADFRPKFQPVDRNRVFARGVLVQARVQGGCRLKNRAMKFEVEQERLLAHLQQIVGDRNPVTRRAKLDAVAVYLETAFRGFGLTTKSDSFERFSQMHHNLVAHIPGSDSAMPPLLVGAHYDGVEGSPAADDNASGVAALLELARLFATAAPLPAPLLLVAFTLEECDLLGSRHLSNRMRESRVALRGMISLEMLGYKSDAPNSQRLPAMLAPLYPTVGNFIGVVGNDRSRALLEPFLRGMKLTSDLPVESLVVPDNGEAIPESRLSDHAPFWEAGYRALMVTDTSFFRNPHYHQATDTLDTLDLKFLTKVTEGVARGVEAVLKSSC
jgi:hypothetical protein